jgi:HAMP domain-containing protein
MRSLRRLGLVLWLAIALVAGQQLVLWHDLGHATESLARAGDPGDPADKVPGKCAQHYTCAQLSGALGSAGLAAAFIASAPPQPAQVRLRVASLAPRHAFHSRGPPASLA